MPTPLPYLPEGRTVKYVPESDPFMREAMRMRNEESTEMLQPTGSVLVKDGQIIGRGANKAAVKNKKIQEIHRTKFCVRRFLKIPTGKKYWACPGCAKLRNHAEVRAIKDAKKKKYQTQGTDLYLYGHWWCCKPCWDGIIKAGVKDVYLVENADQIFQFKR